MARETQRTEGEPAPAEPLRPKSAGPIVSSNDEWTQLRRTAILWAIGIALSIGLALVVLLGWV